MKSVGLFEGNSMGRVGVTFSRLGGGWGSPKLIMRKLIIG